MQLTHHPEQIAPHCTNLDCFASLSDRPSRARPYTLLEGESKTDQSHAMSDHMLVELFLGAELCWRLIDTRIDDSIPIKSILHQHRNCSQSYTRTNVTRMRFYFCPFRLFNFSHAAMKPRLSFARSWVCLDRSICVSVWEIKVAVVDEGWSCGARKLTWISFESLNIRPDTIGGKILVRSIGGRELN